MSSMMEMVEAIVSANEVGQLVETKGRLPPGIGIGRPSESVVFRLEVVLEFKGSGPRFGAVKWNGDVTPGQTDEPAVEQIRKGHSCQNLFQHLEYINIGIYTTELCFIKRELSSSSARILRLKFRLIFSKF